MQRFFYEVESNHDETDHVLGNLYVLADLCNDQSQCNQRLCASALKCVAFAMSQNMISLIVVGFYLVPPANKVAPDTTPCASSASQEGWSR